MALTVTAPYEQHNYMGEYADDASATAAIVSEGYDSGGDPQEGQYYYNTTDKELKIWDNTSWVSIGGGGGTALTSISIGLNYQYTQAETPVEEVVGQVVFNGGDFSGNTITLKAVITPVFSSAGFANVKLYDLGPSGGPPGVPRLVSTLQTLTAGLQYVTQVLTVVSSGAAGDEILDSSRIYEVTVEQSSITSDTVLVGSVSIEVT